MAGAGLWLLWPQDAHLDNYGPVPAFALTDQSGLPVRNTDLNGKVLLFGFIYTNCTDICPKTMQEMRGLQVELRKAGLLGGTAALVTITVDPERDTPQVLTQYAKQFEADFSTWRFLTGTPAEIRRTVVDGFKLGTEHVGHEVVHTDRLLLVDRTGQIRAMYHTADLNAAQVISDVSALR